MIKLVNKMNEWKPRLAVSGWPKEEWTVIGHKASSDSPTSYKCQSGKQEWKNVGTDVWKLGEKRWHSADRRQTRTPWDRLEFGDLATGGKYRIQKHMYTQSEIPESSRARTITHCPPRPPLREGHHSGPNGSANSDPEPPLASPYPLPQTSPSSLFLSTSFLLCSFSLFVCCFFVYFFFKLVYRTRREAACGKELSLLSFDDVNSVVVPQRTFFLWREKKPAVSSLFSFCSLFVSQSFSCFFVNDDKKDLPLNVQDVFSHTWTGF